MESSTRDIISGYWESLQAINSTLDLLLEAPELIESPGGQVKLQNARDEMSNFLYQLNLVMSPFRRPQIGLPVCCQYHVRDHFFLGNPEGKRHDNIRPNFPRHISFPESTQEEYLQYSNFDLDMRREVGFYNNHGILNQTDLEGINVRPQYRPERQPRRFRQRGAIWQNGNNSQLRRH